GCRPLRQLCREINLPSIADDTRHSIRSVTTAFARAALVALALVMTSASPAPAETPAPPATGGTQVTVKDLESLVSTIEDPAKREQLVTQLKALIAAQQGQQATQPGETGLSGALAALSERVRAASADVVETAALILNLPALWRWLSASAADPATRTLWLTGLGVIVAVLGLGALAGWLVAWALARPRRALDARVAHGVLVQLPLIVGGALLDLLPLAAFAAVAYGLLPLFDPDMAVRLIALALINASVLARGITVVARIVLAPSSETRRLLPVASESAAYVFVWIRRFTAVTVYGYFALETAKLLGLPGSLYGLFRNLAGLLFAALLVVFVMQIRRGVGHWLRGTRREESPSGLRLLRARLADIWHVLAVGYIIVGFLVWALRVNGGSAFVVRGTLLSLLVIAIAQLATMGVRRVVDRVFAIGRELRDRYPLLQARANRYLPAVQAALRWIIYAVAALAVLQAWGADAFGWLSTPSGRAVIGRIISITLVVVVALIIWEMISAMIEHRLAHLESQSGRGLSGARLRTLLPFARRAMLIALIIMVAIIVLSEIGIDTAPLLAGAGVVGLAIGFGAQSLVKDVITGLFILIEDSVAVGDIAELGGHTGVVEGMSIRSVRLRDYDGHVHTVPFSEVTTVRNMTKDFSYAVFDIGVAYRENVDEVIQVMVEVAETMRGDSELAPYIMEPLEIGGLDKFADSAVVIRARLKVLPALQWRIGREYNRRLKAEFDRRGIEIPFPQQTVWFGVDKAGNAPPMRVEVEGEAAQAPRLADKAAKGDDDRTRKPS
ncbi:MAG: mechanosensitive ion channel family protein, partial [Candidatus Eiseniibacteriota bacterium]